VAKLDDLVRSTGGAVVLSALTTIASFAALMLGEYGGHEDSSAWRWSSASPRACWPA
jgi:hypothetical protein